MIQGDTVRGKLDASQSSGLTLYTLKSVCTFSVLLFIHFLQCWQGEFAYQSNASFVSDHFLYSHNLDSGVIGRNWMLVTLWVLRVKGLKIRTLSCMVGKTYLCTTTALGLTDSCPWTFSSQNTSTTKKKDSKEFLTKVKKKKKWKTSVEQSTKRW